MTASKIMSLMWRKSVLNSFTHSPSKEEHMHVSSDGWRQYSVGADEILCFLSRIQETVPVSHPLLSHRVWSRKALLGQNFIMVFTSWLSHFCAAVLSQLLLHSASLAHLFRAGLLCGTALLFSLLDVSRRGQWEGCSCLLLSRSEGLFLTFLLYSWGGDWAWEQSGCTPSFRALHTAGERNRHLARVLRNSHFRSLGSVPNFWLNINVWEDPKCYPFGLH